MSKESVNSPTFNSLNVSIAFNSLNVSLFKLGQLKSARENLDKAVMMEPSLVHGYWQRHLLFLLQGKKAEALEDLNHILKVNRLHAGAYISR